MPAPCSVARRITSQESGGEGGFEPPVQVNPAQQVSKAIQGELDDTSLDVNPSSLSYAGFT